MHFVTSFTWPPELLFRSGLMGTSQSPEYIDADLLREGGHVKDVTKCIGLATVGQRVDLCGQERSSIEGGAGFSDRTYFYCRDRVKEGPEDFAGVRLQLLCIGSGKAY